MDARNYSFASGFWRGLNSVSEVYAPYCRDRDDRSSLELMRSDWITVGNYLKALLGEPMASFRYEVDSPSEEAGSPARTSSAGKTVSVHWSGPLPPPGALEKVEQLIPGGADRLLQMAEKQQAHRIECERLELPKAIERQRRGQYLGWTLALLALVVAAGVSLCHGPWQVSVALVGVPVLGAVQALVPGRHENTGRRTNRWF